MGLVITAELIPDSGAAMHCSANLGTQSGECSESCPTADTSLPGRTLS